MTYQLDLSKARGKKTSKEFTDQEKKDVISYLEAHEKDPEAFPYLMKKYNCSQTTLGIICVQNLTQDKQ